MWAEKLLDSIKVAFQPIDFPQILPDGSTRAQKRDYEKRLKAAQRQAEDRYRQRRLLLAGGGVITVAAIGTAAFGPDFARSVLLAPNVKAVSLDELSGEVSQTRDLIYHWNDEVNGDPNRFVAYAPNVATLSAVYVSKQMSAAFPQRAAQYDAHILANRFRFMSPEEFKGVDKCDKNTSEDYVPASEDPLTGEISFSPLKLVKGATYKKQALLTMFLVDIHEQLHTTPPVKTDNSGFVVQQTEQLRKTKINFVKGLRLFNQTPEELKMGSSCYGSWWIEEEETVVEDAATKLSQRVGIINTESNYIPWILDYDTRILRPYFGGRFEDLLEYQQTSDPDDFLAVIGSRMTDNRGSKNERISVATSMIVPMLDRARLK